MTNIAKNALVYNGNVITDKGDMLSLTDMWKAAGSEDSKRPTIWLRQDVTKEFIEVVVGSNMSQDHIQTRRGNNGGTMAHWQIGLAYAKYLSPDFHMWCNQVVREHMLARSQLAPVSSQVTVIDIEQAVRSVIGGIVKGILHKELGEVMPQVLGAMHDEMNSVVPKMVMAQLAAVTSSLRRGETAGQIWSRNGFPPIRRSSWFSNRLKEMGCSIENEGRAEIGGRTVRLFDPDKADLWLRNGGRALTQNYIAEKRGQLVFRLVPKTEPQVETQPV